MKETAPEWYEARKEELAGRGYPSLSDVPMNRPYASRQMSMVASTEKTEALLAAFEADPRAKPIEVTPQEIIAWGQAIRARVNAQLGPANFLTDPEIASLRARFERPRARR